MLIQTEKKIKVEIEQNGIIFVRSQYEIFNDGILVASPIHRDCYTPDMEIETLPDLVKEYARVAWTPEIVETYKSRLV